MRRTRFAHMPCSIARSLDVVGEWWTLLIVRDAFFGASRFEEFHASLGIARNILTDRLEGLVRNGILERRRYQERPPRSEYHLTPKGLDLLPVLAALLRWGDRWTAGKDGPPLVLVHTECGQPTVPVLTCSRCGEPLRPDTVVPQPGPGAGRVAAG